MAKSSNAQRRALRSCAFMAVRHLFERINPGILGNRTELIVRRLGFCHIPEPAEVVANYLRGYVLFGRANSQGAWFQWHWLPHRAVITAASASIPKRLRPLHRRGELEVRYDQDVEAIIRHCQEGREGWLTPEVVNLYLTMHNLGMVTTVGTYRDGRLVGGLWGLGLRRVFAIMSMFHLENNAGALALAALTEVVAQKGRWSVVDCGGPGSNWERYGAKIVTVQQFSDLITKTLLEKNPCSVPSNIILTDCNYDSESVKWNHTREIN
jgi:leucyl/phenylalanyl-tRNA---protein transferase